jgi:hypothetical protein
VEVTGAVRGVVLVVHVEVIVEDLEAGEVAEVALGVSSTMELLKFPILLLFPKCKITAPSR